MGARIADAKKFGFDELTVSSATLKRSGAAIPIGARRKGFIMPSRAALELFLTLWANQPGHKNLLEMKKLFFFAARRPVFSS
jgi:hypothetical protein